MTSEQFKKALLISHQIGAEKVANSENRCGTRGAFDYGIIGELKAELIAMEIPLDTINENEKTAIVYAFCEGWNDEVKNQ